MRRTAIAILLLGPLAAMALPALPWTDRGRLQGAWVVVSAMEGGQPTDQLNGAVYAFDGDTLRIHSPAFEMDRRPYRLRSSRNPKEIDIVVGGAKVLRGIYRLDRDELTLCTANWRAVQDPNGHPGVEPADRPPTFDSRYGSLVVLKRQLKGPG